MVVSTTSATPGTDSISQVRFPYGNLAAVLLTSFTLGCLARAWLADATMDMNSPSYSAVEQHRALLLDSVNAVVLLAALAAQTGLLIERFRTCLSEQSVLSTSCVRPTEARRLPATQIGGWDQKPCESNDRAAIAGALPENQLLEPTLRQS